MNIQLPAIAVLRDSRVLLEACAVCLYVCECVRVGLLGGVVYVYAFLFISHHVDPLRQ